MRTSLIVVAAAAMLHLSAHAAPWSDAPRREPLPEDSPALVRNDALARAPDEGVAAALLRATTDPAAAWDGGADTVGATRWRPVTTSLQVLERALPWAGTPEGAAAGAAVVSLLLHAAVTLMTCRLVRALGGGERAALVAGLLAAASPAALTAAAWPARQAVVVAAALAAGGALIALKGGAARLAAGGVLAALAGLAHEGAFAWAFAIPLLRSLAPKEAIALRATWPAAVPPVLAFVARTAFLGGLTPQLPPSAADSTPAANALDGLVAVLRAAWHFAVPSRTHFADGPHAHPFLVHLAALAGVAVAAALLWPRRREPAAAAALAAGAALLAAPAGLLLGASGAPYQDTNLYLALPLLAAAAGISFEAAARRGGRLRTAAAAAGALLVAATVAATVVRAPSFRTRSALIDLARREAPQSLVVRTWETAERAGASAKGVEESADEVLALAAAASGPESDRLRRDAVAATTISRFLSDYAGRIRVAPLPASHHAFDAGDAAAEAAATLRPNSWPTWVALAQYRKRTGALRGALEAAIRAAEIAPKELAVTQTGAEICLKVGKVRLAADLLERAVARVRSRPGEEPSAELRLLYARALAADGALSVPDPDTKVGQLYRYDLAARELVKLRESGGLPDAETRPLLVDVYVRYGDLLTSIDRTAMARMAYGRALELAGEDPDSEAAQHARWLAERLEEEEAAARARFEAAAKPEARDHQKAANALVELYLVYCRQARLAEADAIFAKLEGDFGRIPPELRLVRAVHRYAALDDPQHKAAAETELRRVLKEVEGDVLARARFELARVVEWKGDEASLAEALRLYETAAREASHEDWSLDALQRAEVVAELLATLGR